MEDHPTPANLSEVQEQLWQTVLQFGNLSASQERNRIARDLHDSLGHSLTALNIQLQTAAKLWQLDPARAAQFLEEAHRLGSTAVKDVRQTVRTLRTDTPEIQSLEVLIADLVEQFYRSTEVLPITQVSVGAPLPGEVITQLYRIIQEALNNICKYAQATVVEIFVNTTSTSLCLVIQDNGRGFNLSKTERGFGLLGMQERVSLLRGQLQVQTAPGEGCRIQVEIPLKLEPLSPQTSLQMDAQMDAQISQVEIAASADRATSAESNVAQIGTILADLLDASTLKGDRPEPWNWRDLDPPLDMLEVLPRGDSLEHLPPDFVLSEVDCDRLQAILLDLIGPIAPLLLQRTLAQVESYPELIEQLSLSLAPDLRQPFAQRAANQISRPAQARADQARADQPRTSQPHHPKPAAPPTSLPASVAPTRLEDSLLQRCAQELTQLIGPIAQFLVQDAITHAPEISLAELVDSLTARISDPQKAAQFRQRMLPPKSP